MVGLMNKHAFSAIALLVATALATFSPAVPAEAQAQGKFPEATSSAANSIFVDLDQPARYTYKSEVVKRLQVGSKDGEIGIQTQADMSFHGPDSAGLDRSGDLYIHDLANRRIERFDKNGGFKEIPYRYSNVEPQFSASQIAVDSRGHIFLNLVLRSPEKFAHWEIFRNKILKRHQQLVLPSAWTGADIPAVDVATHTTAGAEIFVGAASGIKRKQFSLRTTKGLQQLEIILVTVDRVFLRIDLGGKKSLVELDLKRDSFRRIDNASALFVQDDGQYVHAGISADGIMYALRLDEPGGLGAFKYIAEIIRAVPVEVK